MIMSRSESFYNAVSDIKDEYINDAISHNAKKKSGNARIVTEAAACVVIICGFVALSLVLRSISKPTDGNIAASSGTESVIVTNAAQTESDIAENTTVTETAEETAENDRAERLAEALSVVYGHEGTTKTQFKLLDSFDTAVYQTWRSPMLRVQKIYFDEAYDPEPVYSVNPENTSGDPVWYKGPYVRYYVSGYPDYAEDEMHVIHVDICGDDSVNICGINVNSSFEQFSQTFTELGFKIVYGVYGRAALHERKTDSRGEARRNVDNA